MYFSSIILASAALIGSASANLQFSRTIEKNSVGKGTLTIKPGCTGADQYGSNNCALDWGSSYTAAIDVALTHTFGAKSTFSVDAKVDSFIPFKLKCNMCGQPCVVKVPIVSKTINIKMPDCPISTSALNKTKTLVLPAAPSELPKTGIKGKVSIVDDTGIEVALIDFDVTAQK